MVSNAQLRHEARRNLCTRIKHRNQKVLQHIGLAYLVARRQSLRGPEEFDDVQQESSLGLIVGVENFDQARGVKPSSYLMCRSNGQILHYRRDRAKSIRIPWRLRDLFVKGQRIQKNRQTMGLEPLSDIDLAASLNVSLKRWRYAVFAQASTKVQPLNGDELDCIEFKQYDKHLDWLGKALPKLDKNHRDLLQAHLIDGISVKHLSSIMKITPTRIRKMLGTSIKLLQNWAQLDGLLQELSG